MARFSRNETEQELYRKAVQDSIKEMSSSISSLKISDEIPVKEQQNSPIKNKILKDEIVSSQIAIRESILSIQEV